VGVNEESGPIKIPECSQEELNRKKGKKGCNRLSFFFKSEKNKQE